SIANRTYRGDLAAKRYGVGCDTEKFVERAALVRFVTQLEETARPQPSRRHELHLFQDRPAEYTVGIGERLEYFPVGLCHGNANEPALRAKLAKRHAAATAPCHCAVASARKIRSVDRE